jgi:hypothetical protein
MVIPEHYIELMQRAIDGELSVRDQAKLDGFLATSAEARDFYELLRQVARINEVLLPSDPPAQMKGLILSAIDPTRYRSPRAAGIGSWLSETFRWLAAPKLVFGGAFGLLIGIAIGAVSVGGNRDTTTIDRSLVSGTMMLDSRASAVSECLSEAIRRQSFKGQFVVATGEVSAVLRLVVDATTPTTIRLDYDPAGCVLTGFSQRNDLATPVAGTSGMALEVLPGKNEYTFVFRTTGPG